MRIVFLSGLFPESYINEIEKKSIGTIQYAANALQWSIVKGFNSIVENFEIINLPYINSFPFGYRELRIRTFRFSNNNDRNYLNVGFNNLAYYKLLSRYYNAQKYLNKWSNSSNEKKIILIYAIHTPFIKAAINIKRKNPNVKICLIVPDLIQFNGRRTSLLNIVLSKLESSLLRDYLKEIDSFVLLSKYMINILDIGIKPWTCVEGIFDSSLVKTQNHKKSNTKNIFYSGTFAAGYGIMNLLDAFEKITDLEYRLWICGEGELRKEIIKRSRRDPRIIYYGQIPRERVLQLQREATVLVNPRTSEGEFTKYSFPSKTMEYLASGTPSIIHKLPGIPDEYFKFCFVPEEENSNGLYNMIVKVCEMESSELEIFGRKAQDFILKFKNPSYQCGKILLMLNQL